MPVYNAGHYLAECVNSLLAQTYPHREIILVDDGSTDGSAKLCDDYATVNDDVKVIHKPNGGLSSARNAGLECVSGDYICFVDADDAALPEMLSTLVDACRSLDVPMAQGKAIYTATMIAPVSAPHFRPQTTVLTSDDAISRALYQKGVENAAWANIYRADLWKDLRFRDGILYEDLDIFYRVITAAGRMALTTRPVYLYRQHNASIVHRFSRRRTDVLDVTDRLLKWVSRHNASLTEAARTRRLSAHVNILGLLKASATKMPDVRKRCLEVIKADGPGCRKNPMTKPQLRIAMWIYRLCGARALESVLAYGYRRRQNKLG